MSQASTGGGRLGQLRGFLDHDPDNLQLIADTVSAALDAGEMDEAAALVARYEALAALSPAMLNLKGLVALRSDRFDEAVAAFDALLEGGADAPAIRLNLAWALTRAQDFERALAMLDADVLALGASAAALRISVLHNLQRLDEAMAEGRDFAALYPDDQRLMGTLAAAALDAEDVELARLYASRAGTAHDGLATMGFLLLDDSRIGESAALFDRILAADAGNARARLGKGLGLIANGDLNGAAPQLDAAAERFGDHLGSWIAAGWAYYLQGDHAAARARFERALALDDTFAETHGALAVLDLAAGDVEGARRRTETALRLDRNCFGAALAASMLLEHDGKGKAAAKVREAALNFPIGAGGKTVAGALAARNRQE